MRTTTPVQGYAHFDSEPKLGIISIVLPRAVFELLEETPRAIDLDVPARMKLMPLDRVDVQFITYGDSDE